MPADVGGGIRTVNGTTTISGSTISGNTARGAGGISTFSGTVTISGSTISGNTASGNAGGNAGGIATIFGTVTISDSTISGNTASNDGGGALTGSGTVTIISSTLSDNTATGSGDAIRRAGGTLRLENTIIASGSGDNCSGIIISQGHNLSDDGTCSLIQANDLSNTPAGLAPLGDYGGPTQTHHPFAGSAAIDSGSCLTPTDQRGIPRPQGPDCDRGSVEVVEPVDLTTLCTSFYTGAVTSPNSGQCGAGQWQINLPSPWPLTFCIDPFTGQVSFAFGGCTPPRTPHVIPTDGDLLVCWNRFTGELRHVTDQVFCNLGAEIPARIPAVV